MGIIVSIIIGAIAGWLAEQVMKSNHGILMNIILGIGGALILNAILGLVGLPVAATWFGKLIVGFLGACLLIFIGRKLRKAA